MSDDDPYNPDNYYNPNIQKPPEVYIGKPAGSNPNPPGNVGSSTDLTKFGWTQNQNNEFHSGSSGGGCFTGETLVQTPSGLQRIDRLKAGDMVLSWNKATGEVVQRKIQKVKTYSPRQITEIYHNGSLSPLKTTKWHSFLTNAGWRRAGRLNASHAFILANKDSPCPIERVVKTSSYAPVYNLITEKEHNFILDGGIVAHNFTGLRSLRTTAHRSIESLRSFLFSQKRKGPSLRYAC